MRGRARWDSPRCNRARNSRRESDHIRRGAHDRATCAGASPTPASAAMGSPITARSAGMANATPTGASAAMGSSVTGMSSPLLFDGGGMAVSAPGVCAASTMASPPMASTMGPGSTVGRPVGIPLGSTELGGGGLSPPSVALSPTPSAPVMSSLTPLGGMSPPATPSVSAAPSTPNCATTQTGVPTIEGVPTTFGAPLRGRGLGSEATRCR
jgi:hypothetical protein